MFDLLVQKWNFWLNLTSKRNLSQTSLPQIYSAAACWAKFSSNRQSDEGFPEHIDKNELTHHVTMRL